MFSALMYSNTFIFENLWISLNIWKTRLKIQNGCGCSRVNPFPCILVVFCKLHSHDHLECINVWVRDTVPCIAFGEYSKTSVVRTPLVHCARLVCSSIMVPWYRSKSDISKKACDKRRNCSDDQFRLLYLVFIGISPTFSWHSYKIVTWIHFSFKVHVPTPKFR